ncbi:MAG TPA: class I SAM-dependent methyltransferase [Xanthobacteraceae bacterium]|nr:class I SAM-dependent methyltransferase [Xanthobacteraceae bacterium]
MSMADPSPSIHRAAAGGYASSADLYTRGRPEYPEEILAWLRNSLALQSGQVAVDLGAGSGKFTGYLLRTGASVVAVEPVPQMLEKLALVWPDVTRHQGTAEAIPLPDGSVDAVVCAQAFHWFANAAALTEIHRVLKPGGCLGLIWNVRDASVGWVKQLNAIFDRYEDDTPRYANGDWARPFPFAGFGPMRTAHFRHGHTGPADDVIVNRVRSTSFIAALPADEQAKVVAEVRSLIDATPELKGRDLVTMPYVTDAYGMAKVES